MRNERSAVMEKKR